MNIKQLNETFEENCCSNQECNILTLDNVGSDMYKAATTFCINKDKYIKQDGLCIKIKTKIQDPNNNNNLVEPDYDDRFLIDPDLFEIVNLNESNCNGSSLNDDNTIEYTNIWKPYTNNTALYSPCNINNLNLINNQCSSDNYYSYSDLNKCDNSKETVKTKMNEKLLDIMHELENNNIDRNININNVPFSSYGQMFSVKQLLLTIQQGAPAERSTRFIEKDNIILIDHHDQYIQSFYSILWKLNDKYVFNMSNDELQEYVTKFRDTNYENTPWIKNMELIPLTDVYPGDSGCTTCYNQTDMSNQLDCQERYNCYPGDSAIYKKVQFLKKMNVNGKDAGGNLTFKDSIFNFKVTDCSDIGYGANPGCEEFSNINHGIYNQLNTTPVCNYSNILYRPGECNDIRDELGFACAEPTVDDVEYSNNRCIRKKNQNGFIEKPECCYKTNSDDKCNKEYFDKHKNIYVKEKVDCKNLLTKCQHNSTCNTIITQEQEPERIVEQCIDDPLCLDWLRCKDPRYL